MNKKKGHKITEKQVQEYLILHPDFLSNNPEVLHSLEIIHETGGAVSLIQKQVETLRASNSNTTSSLLSLLSVAKNNEEIFKNTQQLIINLIGSKDISEIIEKVELAFVKNFNANKCYLLFFKDETQLPKGRYRDMKKSHDIIKDLYDGRNIYCGPCSSTESDFIFGKKSKMVECVLIPLLNPECPGVIALGSDSEGKYDAQKDTLFLKFIADVVKELIEKSYG